MCPAMRQPPRQLLLSISGNWCPSFRNSVSVRTQHLPWSLKSLLSLLLRLCLAFTLTLPWLKRQKKKKMLQAFQDNLFCPHSGTGEDRACLQKLL